MEFWFVLLEASWR